MKKIDLVVAVIVVVVVVVVLRSVRSKSLLDCMFMVLTRPLFSLSLSLSLY